MAQTVLARHPGYNVRGTTRVVIIPWALMSDGLLDTAAWTDPSAVDVTDNLIPGSLAGFTGEQGDLPDPDVGTLETGTVPGEITFPNSSLTFRVSKAGPTADIRSVLTEGDEVAVVIADQGKETGKTADVIHATVKYDSRMREDISRAMYPFSVHGVEKDVVIPALV
jgi:hypothetical protein